MAAITDKLCFPRVHIQTLAGNNVQSDYTLQQAGVSHLQLVS